MLGGQRFHYTNRAWNGTVRVHPISTQLSQRSCASKPSRSLRFTRCINEYQKQNITDVSVSSASFFKIKYNIFVDIGYFDPEKIFLDNKNK